MSSFQLRKGGKGFYIDFKIHHEGKRSKISNFLQTIFPEDHFQFDELKEMRNKQEMLFQDVHTFIHPDHTELKAKAIAARTKLDIDVINDLKASFLPVTAQNIKTTYEDTYLEKKTVIKSRRVVTNKIKEEKRKNLLSLIDDYTKEYRIPSYAKKNLIWIHEYFGDDLDSVTFPEIRKFYNNYLLYEKPHDSDPNSKGYAGNYVRNIYRIHKGFINYLIGCNLCSNHQWLSIPIVADKGNEETIGLDINSVETLEKAYIENVFNKEPLKQEFLEYMLFAMYIGARNGDLMMLSRDNFHTRNDGANVCRYTSSKTKYPVEIEVDPILNPLIAERSKTEGAWFGAKKFESSNLKDRFSVMLTRLGITHTIECRRRVMHEGKKKMDIVSRYINEEFKGHGLRVTFCTLQYLRHGLEPHEIATISGHLNVAQVDTYLDKNSIKKSAAEKLAQSLKKRNEMKTQIQESNTVMVVNQ